MPTKKSLISWAPLSNCPTWIISKPDKTAPISIRFIWPRISWKEPNGIPPFRRWILTASSVSSSCNSTCFKTLDGLIFFVF